MKCTNCGGDNPEGARFCMSCGQGLSIACGRCGTLLPPAARFCFNCGQPQGESALPPPISPAEQTPQSALQRFIPPELARKLTAAPGEGERRIVTMLFCDVKGSTAAASKLDPEEWVEIINGAFEGMIRPVYQYEGIVARLMGDGILAFFGAPVAHEDDPQRAILAGLGILEAIRAYREEIGHRWGVDFDVRVGINTGTVVVGAVGSDLRLEYTAIGDAINLAARMEQTAQPGTVQVAEDTYRLVAPLFDFEDLGLLEVKGKDKPVRAYRALGRKTQPGRLRGIAGLESSLIGRAQEFQTVRERLDEVGRGTGGALFIIGEAGLGKSRLIAEGRRLMSDFFDDGEWFETASLSYETTQPYGLIQRLFRRVYGVTSAEDPATLRGLMAADIAAAYATGLNGENVADPGESTRMAIEVFERMLTGESGQDGPHLEGESFQARLQQVVRDYWTHRAASGPVVLVFDDLHWSDVASLELLQRIVPLIHGHSILMLFAMRPDRKSPSWAMYEHVAAEHADRFHEIALSPLSVAESSELARGLFRDIDWPPQLQRRIMEKAGGNPFFVEELVRAMLEGGIITQDSGGRWTIDRAAADVELPDTLQGLLLARIDRLEEETRRTLQLASVIGRSFYFQVLAALADASVRLEHQVVDLLAADLIREAARAPELEYMFTHALTQQAAYSSILLKRRREFHRRVGEVMERLFPLRLEELAPILAQHFDSAREWDRAIRYYTLAGDTAFGMYAKAEAAIHYRRAIDIMLQREQSDSSAVDHLFMRLARTLELLARYGEALAVYEEMAVWAAANNEQGMLLASLLGRSTIKATANAHNDPDEALQLLEQAKSLAAATGDRVAEARILWNLMLLSSLNGAAISEQRAYVEQALAVAREAGLREQEAFTLFDSWYHFGSADEWQTAKQHLLAATVLWRDLGNIPLLAETYARLKYTTWFLGEYDQAIEYAEEGYRLARLSHNVEAQAINRSGEGVICIDRGELQRGLDLMEEAVALGHEAEVITAIGGTQAELGYVYGWLGRPPEECIRLAEDAADWLEQRMEQIAGFALAPLSRLYLLLGDIGRANQTLRKLGSFHGQRRHIGFVASIWVATGLVESGVALATGQADIALSVAVDLRATMEKAGVNYLLADVILLEARSLRRLGQVGEAMRAVETAESVARTIGSRRILWEILGLKGELAGAAGDREAAAANNRLARRIVEEMASTLTSPEIQASFRQRAVALLPS